MGARQSASWVLLSEPFWGRAKSSPAELIPALLAAEFYRIHALTYKGAGPAPGAHIFEARPHIFFAFPSHRDLSRTISRASRPPSATHESAADTSMGRSASPEVGWRMIFVSASSTARTTAWHSQFGKSSVAATVQDISHHTEHLRITPAFHSQQQTARAHASAPSRSPNLVFNANSGPTSDKHGAVFDLMFFWGQPSMPQLPDEHSNFARSNRKPAPGLSRG